MRSLHALGRASAAMPRLLHWCERPPLCTGFRTLRTSVVPESHRAYAAETVDAQRSIIRRRPNRRFEIRSRGDAELKFKVGLGAQNTSVSCGVGKRAVLRSCSRFAQGPKTVAPP